MKITAPGAWQVSPGMAEMGWASSGIPGALVADGRPAIALVGDGAFNMTSQVVATAVEYDLPAIWVVLNNYELGIERKGMERSYSRSPSVVPLPPQGHRRTLQSRLRRAGACLRGRRRADRRSRRTGGRARQGAWPAAARG